MSNQQVGHVNEAKSKDFDINQQNNFTQRLIYENTLASNDFRGKEFNLESAKKVTAEGFAALGATNGLQAMLAAQMLSIHQLQQKSMTCANTLGDIRLQQYYTNAAIKLTNCFVQQANIFARLQGVGGQKIIVERVDVHQGGQAIVGTVQAGHL